MVWVNKQSPLEGWPSGGVFYPHHSEKLKGTLMMHPIRRNFLRFSFVALLLAVSLASTILAKDGGEVKFNVFAVVSASLEEQARTVSQLLFEQAGVKTFPHLGYQIHCTLYMTKYPATAENFLRRRVEGLAAAVRKFPVSSGGVEKTSGDWLFVNLERNRNLQRLSDEVVNLLASLRSKNQEIPGWAKKDPKKLEMIEKYGSPNVFSEFNPHLTLLARTDGWVLDRFMIDNEDMPSVKDHVAGEIVAIGYGIADQNGQMEKPVAIFPLKDSN